MSRVTFLAWIVITLIAMFSSHTFGDDSIDVEFSQNPQKLLLQIQNDQNQLDALNHVLASDLEKAQKDNPDHVPYLKNQQVLVDKYLLVYLDDLQKETLRGQALMDSHSLAEAQVLLLTVKKKYDDLLSEFDLIAQTIKAEVTAEETKLASKMFIKMKMGSKEFPPKTLKAYGLMGLAKRNRDEGRFVEALRQWEQAEIMVKEANIEYIEKVAKWSEVQKQEADKVSETIRVKVEALLSDSFVNIPAGDFNMGSLNGSVDETPVHKVSISAFKMSKTEVTFELWDLCVKMGGCYYMPSDQGWGRGSKPVVSVSHKDIIMRFLPWLNKLTEKKYRLPSESEWEYAARAGTTSEYSWGDHLLCTMSRFNGGVASACDAQEAKNKGPAVVKTYKPNNFGLYDMHGNAWEWVEDCWFNTYEGAPSDSRPRGDGNCAVRVLRGGSWEDNKNSLRSANRYYAHYKDRKPGFGFRIVLDE